MLLLVALLIGGIAGWEAHKLHAREEERRTVQKWEELAAIRLLDSDSDLMLYDAARGHNARERKRLLRADQLLELRRSGRLIP